MKNFLETGSCFFVFFLKRLCLRVFINMNIHIQLYKQPLSPFGVYQSVPYEIVACAIALFMLSGKFPNVHLLNENSHLDIIKYR